MKYLGIPTPTSARQLNLLLDTGVLEGLDARERGKAVLVLAQILLQAAGVSVEELADDKP